MKDFWVAHWLHCPPEREFVNGRRVILKHLCFGPAESRVWFATEEGGCWYEERTLEGVQAGEPLLEPVGREELQRLLSGEVALCRRLRQEELIPLFQEEKERWR